MTTLTPRREARRDASINRTRGLRLHPSVWYLVTWAIVGLLYSLRLTSNLGPVDPLVLLSVLGAIPCVATIAIHSQTRFPPQEHRVERFNPDRGLLRFYSWIGISVIGAGALLDRRVPLVSILSGTPVHHKDFGITSITGPALALGVVAGMAALDRALQTRSHPSPHVLWLGAPILLIDRLSMSLTFLAVLTLVAWHNSPSRRALIISCGVLLGLVLLAGFIGDNRLANNDLDQLKTSRGQDIFDGAPSGFFWSYVYATSPLSNLAANINIDPTYRVEHSLSAMVPRVLSGANVATARHDAFDLTHPQLTASTGYSPVISDFGTAGALILSTGLLVASHCIYRGAQEGRRHMRLLNAIGVAMLVLMVFDNVLFRPSSLFLVGGALLLRRRNVTVGVSNRSD